MAKLIAGRVTLHLIFLLVSLFSCNILDTVEKYSFVRSHYKTSTNIYFLCLFSQLKKIGINKELINLFLKMKPCQICKSCVN